MISSGYTILSGNANNLFPNIRWLGTQGFIDTIRVKVCQRFKLIIASTSTSTVVSST